MLAKKIILNELCAITLWHRDHAGKALRFCWAVQGTPCGHLLAAALTDLAPRLRAFSELDISDETAVKLLKIAPATIKRTIGYLVHVEKTLHPVIKLNPPQVIFRRIFGVLADCSAEPGFGSKISI